MKLIVGLGNPGRRYQATPHNIGFEVVDLIAERWGLTFSEQPRLRAALAEGAIAGRTAQLLKPLTYMNLSGEAVAAAVRQRELSDDDLLIVTDDANLPIGRLRIRPRGGAGGHNGLRSMMECLGHDGFARLRVGIEPPWRIDDLERYVLAKLPPLERGQLEDVKVLAADAAEMWLREGSAATADRFNGARLFHEEGR